MTPDQRYKRRNRDRIAARKREAAARLKTKRAAERFSIYPHWLLPKAQGHGQQTTQ